jgi:hypothetical protein
MLQLYDLPRNPFHPDEELPVRELDGICDKAGVFQLLFLHPANSEQNSRSSQPRGIVGEITKRVRTTQPATL